MPTTELILYQFSRDRVEAGDAKDFLSSFGKSSLPTGKKLESMMNSVALMIDGYNHDPREIYAIPEVILASWITKAKADEPLDTLTPPCESYEREEVVVIGQAPQGNITHLLPIHRLDNGKFWYLGDAVDMPADGFEGRFAGLFSSKPPDEQKRQMGKKLLDAMG